MSATAQYTSTPKSSTVNIATANTNRDGVTGTYGTLHTAGASGGRIDQINITATSTTTAGMVRLFVDNALVKEVPVIAITPSGTQPAFSVNVDFDNGLILEAASVVTANTHNAESFNLTVTNGGDF